MGDQKDDARAYSYETVRALMHYRDVEIARMSAELAALKLTHQKLTQIAYSIVQLDRTANPMDIVSEGIRPIAEDTRRALAQDREAAELTNEVEPS